MDTTAEPEPADVQLTPSSDVAFHSIEYGHSSEMQLELVNHEHVSMNDLRSRRPVLIPSMVSNRKRARGRSSPNPVRPARRLHG